MEKRNISIAKINGYTYEKVMLAKQYLEEIGTNRRNFPYDKLVTYYNNILGTNESTQGCKCQAPKYYNGIQNYFNYGKLTLINNGLASEEDFAMKQNVAEEIAPNRINLGTKEESRSESIPEDEVNNSKGDENKASDGDATSGKETIKDRMARVRAARGKK